MEQDPWEEIARGSAGVRVPSGSDRILKWECLFSFDTPLSDGGLFTSLTTFKSVGSDFLEMYAEKTGSKVFLHAKTVRTRKEKRAEANGTPSIDASSGGVKLDLKEDLFEESTSYSIALMPGRISVPFPDERLPEVVQLAAAAVISASNVDPASTLAATEWEEKRAVSKYAKDLPQLDNGIKISPDPSTWVCADSGMKENLWLNLSTGNIGSGRKHWDGTGGTGAALKHYEETGRKYPLCVKLGTITPRGADVFSYAEDENDMVEDPYLAEHLQHWGINMQAMEQTDKTMAEMEVELNTSFEFRHILEGDTALEPITGPGLVGLENLGNSCYMNSILQLLFTAPEVREKYFTNAEQIFRNAPEDAQDDLTTQLAKIAVALSTDRYLDKAIADKQAEGLFVKPRPQMFKNLIGKGHPEFSTGRQQDAIEFFQYLMEKVLLSERAARGASEEGYTPNLFKFKLEERTEDEQSGQVRYKIRTESVLPIVIDIEAAKNREVVREYEEQQKKRAKLRDDGEQVDDGKPVKLEVPFSACLTQYFAPRTISDFTSPVTGGRGIARQRLRFSSFPRYLMIQMMRFQFAEDWTPVKLDALVDLPDMLDLREYRGTGAQEGEVLLPEDSAGPPRVVPDAAIVGKLVEMGFSENGSKRAAIATNNANAEAGMEWMLQHMDDPDVNDPPQESGPGAAGAQSGSSVRIKPEDVANLHMMGFTEEQATAALEATGGSVERAADWLLSRIDELDAAVAEVKQSKEADATTDVDMNGDMAASDGEGLYELVGFVSHIGKHTQMGHYVAHVNKNGQWVLFNDSQVATTTKPPKDLGYTYLYRRVQA